MRRDDSSLVDFDELAALLRAHEGPPKARISKRRRRPRVGLAVGAAAVALLVGSGLGFGLASSLTPSGDAAQATRGLGFVPERGWQAVRSGFEASAERPSFAIVSNVPLARLDVSLARRTEFSGYPGRTLERLGPRGIVLVASFDLRGVHAPSDESFPHRALPLRLRDATSSIRGSGYFPRTRPVAWYELRAAVGDHNIIVNVFFGSQRPTRALILAAQRQLDRLVVGSAESSSRVEERALTPHSTAPTGAGQASRVVDRTFACRPQAFGGVGDLEIYVTPPGKVGSAPLPGIPVAPPSHLPGHLLVYTDALRPGDTFVVVRPLPSRQPGRLSAVAGGVAGVFIHSRRCVSASASVGLSFRGLLGPPSIGYRELDCPVRGRVLVRIRSVLRKPVEWRRIDRTFDGVRQPVVRSQLAVRSERTNKPIAYMEHDAKGKTKLWFSSQCT